MSVVSTVIYSFVTGIVALALLEYGRDTSRPRNPFFIGILVLLMVYAAGELYIHTGVYRYAPGIAGLDLPFRVLLGPALYFYVSSTLSREPISYRAWLAAATGPVVVTLMMVPFLFAISPEDKLALADPATRDPALWRIAVMTCLGTTVVFVGFTACFMWASLRLHGHHRDQLMSRFSAIESRSLDWFRPVLMLWGLAWLVYATKYGLGALGVTVPGFRALLPVMEAGVLTLFIHRVLNQPALAAEEREQPQPAAPRRPVLDLARMQSIAAKLDAAMREQRLYLDEDLSLAKLSSDIGVSENHISETLSQHLGTHFFHYVNGFRIEEAKRQLADGPKLVSTIAFDVGFNSKSTFNTAFKRMVGCTPTAYRRQCAG